MLYLRTNVWGIQYMQMSEEKAQNLGMTCKANLRDLWVSIALPLWTRMMTHFLGLQGWDDKWTKIEFGRSHRMLCIITGGERGEESHQIDFYLTRLALPQRKFRGRAVAESPLPELRAGVCQKRRHQTFLDPEESFQSACLPGLSHSNQHPHPTWIQVKYISRPVKLRNDMAFLILFFAWGVKLSVDKTLIPDDPALKTHNWAPESIADNGQLQNQKETISEQSFTCLEE